MDINLNESKNYYSEKTLNTNYSNNKTDKNEINNQKIEDEKIKNENDKIINDIKILLDTIKKTDNEYKKKLLKLDKKNNDINLKKYNSTKDLYKNNIYNTEFNKLENRSDFLEEAFKKFEKLEFDEVYKLLNLYLKKFKDFSDKKIEKYLNKYKQSPPNFLLKNINNINNLIKKQNFQIKIKKLSNLYNLNYEDKLEQLKKNELILNKFENMLINLILNK